MGEISIKILGISFVSGLLLSFGLDPEGILVNPLINIITELSSTIIGLIIIIFVLVRYTDILRPIIKAAPLKAPEICTFIFGFSGGIILLGNSIYSLILLVIGGLCARVGS